MKQYWLPWLVMALIIIGLPFYFLQAASLAQAQSGKILLQVEQNGEAWYVYPNDLQRYYLGRPDDAFSIMRSLGLGVAHGELQGYLNSSFPTRLSGLIVLDVEANGEAYYVYPNDRQGYYLGRPDDAFSVMREKGLGISDADLAKISVASGSPAITSDDSADGAEDSNEDTSANNDTPSITTTVVVDTNQTECFNASASTTCPSTGSSYYGQDAQYSGVQPSYTDNGDGTVTDNNTGLMWQQDPGEKVNYDEAVDNLGGFSLAGYTDWRLPTITELYSLMDFSGEDVSSYQGSSTAGLRPFIDDDIFDFNYGDTSQGQRIIDSQWVTSNVYNSTVMNNQACFFGVNFADGRIKCYPLTAGGSGGYYTIYVRGGDYGQQALTDNGNGTITDASVGLMWQQSDSQTGLNWSEALDYCEDLSLASQTDWRLPNAKELQYLVDYSRSPDATNSAAIDPLFSVSTITNEAGQTDYPFYWSSTTHANTQGGASAVYVAFGRALGYMSEFGGWIDVHGAGAQRSDPKTGSASQYPTGHGPQGDAVRIDNYVRCVRDV